MNREININGRIIGDSQPCYIIAEMSANHAGSYERAVEIIKAAKDSGADCIKIQTYTPDTMTIDCDNDYFNIKKGTWNGENLYKLYEKAYTPWEWQEGLKKEAENLGIDFLSTPFDKTSVDFLEKLGVNFYKIASFELVDIPLIKYIASKNKPIILSTGMGTLAEIEEAVNAIKSVGNEDLCLLKCSSAYPAIPDDMNLMTMKNLKNTFQVPVGLSDHSLGSIAAVTAVAMGAKIIEKHFCLSRSIENPDASFSMEPQEFKKMVEDIRAAEKAIGKVSYRLSDKENQSKIFRRSIFIVKDIKKGDKFTEENIRIIRPGDGLKPKYYDDVLGKSAAYDIERGTPLSWDKVI
jgi:pseudaminic acid synthase